MSSGNIKDPIEKRLAQLETEIAELKKVRRINRWLIAGLGVIIMLVAPIFAASLMSGNFGIGIASPLDTLDVNGDIRVRGADINDAGGTNRIRITDNGASNLYDAGGTIRLSIADGGNTNFFDSGGSTRISLDSAGNIGMGVSSPTAKLDVRGDVRHGASGQYYSFSAPERIRIVRGRVIGTGVIEEGTGFSVAKGGTGIYNLTWSPVFATEPSTVVTINWTAVDSHCNTAGGGSGSTVTVRCYTAGALADREFSFITIGDY